MELKPRILQKVAMNSREYQNIPVHTDDIQQRSGIFLDERATIASYFKLNFHENHTIGYWCHMAPQKSSDSTLI